MVQLLLTIVLLVLLCAAAVWVMGQLAPGHPPIIDRLIWVVCVILVAFVLISAFGLVDIPVPRFR
jgi:hypothetical protein